MVSSYNFQAAGLFPAQGGAGASSKATSRWLSVCKQSWSSELESSSWGAWKPWEFRVFFDKCLIMRFWKMSSIYICLYTYILYVYYMHGTNRVNTSISRWGVVWLAKSQTFHFLFQKCLVTPSQHSASFQVHWAKRTKRAYSLYDLIKLSTLW